MLTGSVLGIFATEEGGVPKPSVDSIDVRLNGVFGERIQVYLTLVLLSKRFIISHLFMMTLWMMMKFDEVEMLFT